MRRHLISILLLLACVTAKAQDVKYVIAPVLTTEEWPAPLADYKSISYNLDDRLSSVFSTEGEPLMDMLVLLDKDDTDADRCLVFVQKDGIYVNVVIEDAGSKFQTDFNPTERPFLMSVSALATVASNFGTTFHAVPRIYLSGTCLSAAAQIGDDQVTYEGFFEIAAADGESADIYVENANIRCKQKTLDIDNMASSFGMPRRFVEALQIAKRREGVTDLLSALMDPQVLGIICNIPGMSCPVVLGSQSTNTATPATLNIHIKGNNCFTGGITNLDLLNMGFVQMVSSPIAIRSLQYSGYDDVENTSGLLSFDDVWPIDNDGNTFRTNGLLDLPVAPTNNERGTPSIDLGIPNGQCCFNGGQYVFQTAANSNMFFVSSMSICYKQFSMAGIRGFGIGSSVSTSTTAVPWNVHIESGTFTTHSAEEYASMIDVVGRGWYNDYTDLRLPLRSVIEEGATFNNCHAYLCDAAAEVGIEPFREEEDMVTGTRQTIQLCRKRTEVAESDIDPATGLKTGTTMTPVKEADDKYYVYQYVPTDQCDDQPEEEREYVHNWVTVIPKMGLNAKRLDPSSPDIDILVMGGDVTVNNKTADELHNQKNAFLFYAQLNEYTKQNASVQLGPLRPSVQQAINMAAGAEGTHEFSEILNAQPYTIEHGLYTMMSFHSNQWYTLCVPYDVHNIYVMETNGSGDGTREFLDKQGLADGDLAQTIVTSLCPDILSGKGSGVNLDLIEIAQQQLGMTFNSDNSGKGVYSLKHYNPELTEMGYSGYSAAEASFYLYMQTETDPLRNDGYWNVTNMRDISKFWTYAPLIEPETTYTDRKGDAITQNLIGEDVMIVMQKGKIYSIYLPDESGNNYWEGKYLVFEGYGPQTIDGKNSHSTFPDLASVTASETEYGEELADLDGISVEELEEALAETEDEDDRQLLSKYITIVSNGLTQASYLAFMGNSTFGNYTPDVINGLWQPYYEDSKLSFKAESRNSFKPFDTWLVASDESMTLAKNQMGKPARLVKLGDTETGEDDRLPHIDDVVMRAWQHNGLDIAAYADIAVEVFSVDGRKIWGDTMRENTMRHISVSAGIYIIKANNQTAKVLIQQ